MSIFLRTKQGELFCGDRYLVEHNSNGTLYVVIDAIGHGKEASRVADIALQSIKDTINMKLVNIIEAANSALIDTRGAVIYFVFYLPEKNKAYYYGLSNIRCLLIAAPGVVKLTSVPGYFGQKKLTITLNEVEVTSEALLLMFTDVADEIKVETYPLLQKMNSRHLVQILSNQWSGQDDICCLCRSLYE